MPIHIPYDSNLHFLPLMYFLPQDTIAKCPTLRTMPRKVREIIYSDEMMAIVNSDQFLNEIMDAGAAMIFPHFGFGGWKEHYTMYCPVYRLSYNAFRPVCKLLETEINWGLQALMLIPSSESIPYFAPEYITETIGHIVKRVISEQGWQPLLDVQKEMPCDEDFENWDTNVRKDFLRKWYHTRSKKVQTVSLEACMEDEEHGIYEIAADICDVGEIAAGNDFAERFTAQLSKRDMEILELRSQGFKYKEIGEKLGYKNPSGVIKRMQTITKSFLKYEEEQQ